MATVSKNIFWSTLTSVLQLYTGSAVFIILAKLMSVPEFGILSFGFSLSAIAVIVADFGFSLMIMKDYPRQGNHGTYLSSSIVAKILLAIGAALFFLIYLLLFYEGQWLTVGLLYVVFALVASFTIYLQALLRVQNKFDKYAESGLVYAIAVTLVVIVYWQFQLSLVQLVVLLLGCKIVQLIWTLVRCKASFPNFSYKIKGIPKLIGDSWSFGVFGVLGIFYFMVDTQIISVFLGAKDVALYQSVFRIVLILMVFSDIISNVLLPYLSFKFYNKENVTELVSKIFLYLLIIGCSWFLLFTSLKAEILEILYTTEYLGATILVVPFSIVIVLRTVSTLLGNILTISDRQTARVFTVGVSLAISLALNLIFIPKYGIVAAAWTSVLVHLILFGMYWFYSKMEVPAMKIFSPSSIFVIVVTIVLYFIADRFGSSNYWIVVGCALFWLLTLALVMRRDNNLDFLQMVLKEKGAG
ncbi:MAG: oligosaccharide flippase family protein [Aurantibacter sp.]